MKTPREILLSRHRRTEPKLDAIRKRVLAEHDEPSEARLSLSFIVMELWRELIRPCRQVWGGLAAVWVAIAVFNFATTAPTAVASAKAPARNREVRMAVAERKRLIAQL